MIVGHKKHNSRGGEMRPKKIIIPRPIAILCSGLISILFTMNPGCCLLAFFSTPSPQEAILPGNLARAIEQMDREISLAAAEDRFSGVVLVAKDFKPVFFKPWGMASREFAVPNRLNTKFNLGSINKVFTKIAIGQLVEKGLISFDDKIGQFLPHYPNQEAREKVTVRHLVEMTSGIGDFFGPDFQNTPKNHIRHNRDYLRLFASKPLAFVPGTKEMYSNGGYVVLGEIIAAAAKVDYYAFIRKNIFEVAGMKDSDWYEADIPVANLAEGYTQETAGKREDAERRSEEKGREESAMTLRTIQSKKESKRPESTEAGEAQKGGPWRKNIYTRPARGSAAGGGYSTAEDLLHFIKALYEGQFLSPPYTDWVFGGPEPGKGKILEAVDIQKKSWNIGIAGGAPGINAVLEFDARDGWTIIVLANLDPPAATQISRLVQRHLSATSK